MPCAKRKAGDMFLDKETREIVLRIGDGEFLRGYFGHVGTEPKETVDIEHEDWEYIGNVEGSECPAK